MGKKHNTSKKTIGITLLAASALVATGVPIGVVLSANAGEASSDTRCQEADRSVFVVGFPTSATVRPEGESDPEATIDAYGFLDVFSPNGRKIFSIETDGTAKVKRKIKLSQDNFESRVFSYKSNYAPGGKAYDCMRFCNIQLLLENAGLDKSYAANELFYKVAYRASPAGRTTINSSLYLEPETYASSSLVNFYDGSWVPEGKSEEEWMMGCYDYNCFALSFSGMDGSAPEVYSYVTITECSLGGEIEAE